MSRQRKNTGEDHERKYGANMGMIDDHLASSRSCLSLGLSVLDEIHFGQNRPL